MCMHRACLNATCLTDVFNTKIGMNKKGEIRLKQKTMSVAKDQFLTCIDLMEIRENFICGMKKYLVLEGDMALGAPQALACTGMFWSIPLGLVGGTTHMASYLMRAYSLSTRCGICHWLFWIICVHQVSKMLLELMYQALMVKVIPL